MSSSATNGHNASCTLNKRPLTYSLQVNCNDGFKGKTKATKSERTIQIENKRFGDYLPLVCTLGSVKDALISAFFLLVSGWTWRFLVS